MTLGIANVVFQSQGDYNGAMARLNGIKETCLDVQDLEQSEQFYSNVLGLTIIAGDAHFRALSVAASHVLLLFLRGQRHGPVVLPGGIIPPHGTQGHSHIGFAIAAEELEQWKAIFADYGVPIESTVEWPGGGRSVYFRDPDQHLLELLTPGVWSIY